MKPAPTLTACCQVTAYADPVCVVGGRPVKIRIGSVARCGQCHKLKSGFRADNPNGDKELTRLIKLWTGSTESMMVDDQIKRPGAPLNFEVGTVGLVPYGYKGEVKDQPELDGEVPF